MRLILALFVFLLVSPLVAFAAMPGAALTTSPDRHFVYLTFSGLQSVSKVNYTLVYDSNNRQKGFEGGFKTMRYSSKSTRRQILGTCSSGKCVYHKSPRNFALEVSFTLKTGGTTTITRSLP